MPDVLRCHMLSTHNTHLYSYCQENLVPSASASKKRTLKKKSNEEKKKMKTKSLNHGLSLEESLNQKEVPWMTTAQPDEPLGPKKMKSPQVLALDQCKEEAEMLPVECVLTIDPPAHPHQTLNDASEVVENEDGPMILTDNLKEMCQFMCGICRKTVTVLRFHLGYFHQMSLKEYRLSYPDIYVRKTHHRYSFLF